MGETSIEWTDKTWNPVRGCSRVSSGCVNCYAERQAYRFSNPSGRARTSPTPFAGFVQMTNGHPQWTGKVQLVEEHLNDPLHWRDPKRVFVNSMSDLFHESLPFSAIDEVFTVMIAAPHHTYQILTKRPTRMLEYFSSGRHDGGMGPDRRDYHMDGEKIWLGVSVEEQQRADERIPLLFQTPAAVRFVSYEPALGTVDFRPWLTVTPQRDRMLDWIIVGGESGPNARPFDIEWARNTVAQCKAAGVACFVKQLGAKPFYVNNVGETHSLKSPLNWHNPFSDRKGGDMAEWPQDLRVREFPEAA